MASPPAPPDRPNVLFLLSDEHSYRFLGRREASEGEPVTTPTLDALAAHSAVFDATYCQAPLCTPSRMCLLTGREAMACGAWRNCSYLDPDLETLPGAFADAGYETCLVGKMHFGGNRQHYGFRHRPYGDLSGYAGHQRDPLLHAAPGHPLRSRTADAGITDWPESQLQEQIVVRETLAFLREHRHAQPDQPWFLCASFSRPHFPLTAPRRWFDRYWPHGVTEPKVGPTGDTFDHPMTRGMRQGFLCDDIEHEEMMKARAGYFACVSYLDEILGDMLAMLECDGLLENTIVVYTSDHGEMAGEHGLWWKNTWHEASVRVPWFVQLPAHRSGSLRPSQLQTPVSLGDLFPTLCGLAGVTPPQGLTGHDLTPAVRTGSEPALRGMVCSDGLTDRWGAGTAFRMVRDGRYKFVAFADAPPLLFDLEVDPLEQQNLAAAPDAAAAARLERLGRFVSDTLDFRAATARREAAEALQPTRELPGWSQFGNLYRLPDGRLIDADRAVVDPHVFTASAAIGDATAPPSAEDAENGAF